MDIIEMTRELGRALQNDERYIAMMAARQASDEDEALQEAIGEFNLKRMAISNEAQKEERDDEDPPPPQRRVPRRVPEDHGKRAHAPLQRRQERVRRPAAADDRHPQPVRRGRGPRHLRRVLLRRQLRQLRRLPLRNTRGRPALPWKWKGLV